MGRKFNKDVCLCNRIINITHAGPDAGFDEVIIRAEYNLGVLGHRPCREVGASV